MLEISPAVKPMDKHGYQNGIHKAPTFWDLKVQELVPNYVLPSDRLSPP
ncbi:unnamed protein product [Ectocarpus sp. 4 AP-2014]